MGIHNSRCPNSNNHVQVSLDGVTECKSTLNTLDVYSIRFSGCQKVYPIQIVRPIGKYRVDQKQYLDQFLTDVCSNNCIIDSFMGDNPKRATAKNVKSHSSYFPCEYCVARGKLLNKEDREIVNKKCALNQQKISVQAKLEEAQNNNDEAEVESLTSVLKSVCDSIKTVNRKYNNIVWPSSTQNAPARTMENVIAIANRIENGEKLSPDESQGIVGRSLLLDIPYFHFVLDVPTEYLHSLCLGVGKRTIELTFNVGENRKRITTRKLSDVALFNRLMSEILVVREFSRRARNLDFSVMKGQEYRNIVLFFFPIVIKCIEPQAKERRLWLLLAYMTRACVLPNTEFETFDHDVIEYCGRHFYNLYEQLFGVLNCSYNTHVVSCHMPEMRVHGPLTLTSAFGFESFYGEMRHAFTPRTISPLKQIMSKILMKRTISSHCCKPTIFYSPRESAMESNCYIYTFNDKQYNFFKIKEINDNSMQCFKVGKYPKIFPETPTLNWSNIGVFEAGGISDEIVTVAKHDISGKILRVDNLYITCPINVLEEK